MRFAFSSRGVPLLPLSPLFRSRHQRLLWCITFPRPHLVIVPGNRVWTVIPLALVTVVFFWGFVSFMQATVAPADALRDTGLRQALALEFEYPNGTRTINEIHVPVASR